MADILGCNAQQSDARLRVPLLQEHAELLESYAMREAAAANYMKAVRPGVAVHTGELRDPKARILPCCFFECSCNRQV